MIALRTITVLETVIDFLHEKNQTVIFGYKDTPVVPLQKKLQKDDITDSCTIKYLLVDKDHNNLFHAIETYYRETAKAPIIFTTTKCEFANLLKILGMATNRGIPVICFCGESRDVRYKTLFGNNLDIHRLQRCCTKYTYEFDDMGKLPSKLEESYDIANHDKNGSVLLHIPLELQNELIIGLNNNDDRDDLEILGNNKKELETFNMEQKKILIDSKQSPEKTIKANNSIFNLLDKKSREGATKSNVFYGKNYPKYFGNNYPENEFELSDTKCEETKAPCVDLNEDKDSTLSNISDCKDNLLITDAEILGSVNKYKKGNPSLIFTSLSDNFMNLLDDLVVNESDRLISHNERGLFSKIINFLEIFEIQNKLDDFGKKIVIIDSKKFLDNLGEFASFSKFLRQGKFNDVRVDFVIINDCLYKEVRSLEYNYYDSAQSGTNERNEKPNIGLLLKSFGVTIDSFAKKDNIPLCFEKMPKFNNQNVRFFEFKILDRSGSVVLNV